MTTTLDSPASEVLTETEPEEVRAKKRTADLWRAAMRWHFYAGVFVMPVLFVLALTGLGMTIKPTLESAFYGNRLNVPAVTSSLPYATQMDAVLAAYPGATIRSVTPPPHDERSTQIDITATGGTDLSVYVDPSNAQVLGAIENGHRFNNVLEKIHGTLWVGTLGDYFIELVAGWTLVMMASGLYLWWPRKKGGWRSSFGLGVRTKGRRRLREMHATPGAIFAAIIFVLVITGLPWSGFWGKYWGQLSDDIGQGANAPETPTSNLAASSLETQGLQVAWASDRKAVPFSIIPVHDGGAESSDDHYHATPEPNVTTVEPTTMSIEDVAKVGDEIGMNAGYSIGLPEDETGVFTLSNSWPSVASAERTAFVDQYKPNVLTDHGWADYGVLAKATSLGIDSHMGRQFGPLNAIVMMGACLTIIGAVLTSPLMWWKRRNGRGTGFPKRTTDVRMVRGVIVIAVVLGLLFPLLGASMIVVALLDRFVFPRIPAMRRLFANT